MNQDHLMQSGLKDQQDWIFKDKLRFGGVGAINILNWWLSQRLCMFVAIITYLVIITRVLRNNHIKTRWFNWLLWWSLWWRWWCCWWKWKRPGCHHRCQIGGVKYTIHRSKSSLCPFIIFANNPSWWFEETMKNQTIHKKAEKHSPPQSMLQWPWTCASISFFQASKVNSPYLPITCLRPIFMAWVLLMLHIIYVRFILGINLN